MYLLIGVIFLFFGCTKDILFDTKLNQEEIGMKVKKVHTHFIGECTLIHFSPENAWYDYSELNPRVTGVSIWVTDMVNPIDEFTFELVGTAELFVGATVVGDPFTGKWEMTWKGTQTLTSPDGSTFRIVCHALGTGIGGDVDGLTARWKYTMDFDGNPETLKYITKGKITEVY